MSADLWAGAEVQLAATAAHLVGDPGLMMSAVLFNEGRLATELRRLGVSVAIIDETRTNSLGIVRFLVRFLGEHRIELVHTHRYKDTVLGYIAAKLAGVRYAVRTMHGLREPMTGWARVKFLVYEALERAVFRCFGDLVIAVSQQMSTVLQRSGYPPSRIVQIHNGVDIGAVRATRSSDDLRRELGVHSSAFLVGTVGRLSPVKGHAIFLHAAKLILADQPAATFLIVGDGPQMSELRALAANLEIDGSCLFVGHRADVHDLVSAMNVFVLPSLAEGIPMAALEAMALGTPVVASAVGGVPEVVCHRENGLLVPSGNHRAVADACIELARDRALSERLVERARGTVEEKFSQTRSGGTLVRSYRQLARRTRVGSVDPRDSSTRAPGVVRRCARTLLDRATRRLECASVRRQMTWVRRNPGVATDAARSAQALLIVCQGNIIRSPFAEHVIKRALGVRGPRVASAGLEALPGRPPHPTALQAAKMQAIDLSDHHASRLSRRHVATSDLILVMDVPLLVALLRRFPEARGKTFVFTCLAPEVPLEVDDPVNGDRAMFDACFDQILTAAVPLIQAVAA